MSRRRCGHFAIELKGELKDGAGNLKAKERVLGPTPHYLSSMNQHSFRHILWLMSATIFSTFVWGQSPLGSLPKGISAWEKAQWLAHPLNINNPSILRGIPSPPPGSELRTSAEWEEIEVLTITWELYEGQPTFPCILKQIASAATQECRVVVFSENVSQTTSYLSSNNCGGAVLMDSVDVVDAEYNSIWIRDYGANTGIHRIQRRKGTRGLALQPPSSRR